MMGLFDYQEENFLAKQARQTKFLLGKIYVENSM